MGRVIDSLAASLGVQNNNNLQSADKLNLFRSADGESVSEDTSLELEKVLNMELLFNGDAVTLEYVVQWFNTFCRHVKSLLYQLSV